jgi:hypothetical protein
MKRRNSGPEDAAFLGLLIQDTLDSVIKLINTEGASDATIDSIVRRVQQRTDSHTPTEVESIIVIQEILKTLQQSRPVGLQAFRFPN